ncbi:retropepsin-like aspartic protease [Nonomuraea maheshkhaliensis]|uniref:retropepsin-like aspartic protease n=1 Tax=Nonomuraea maheshkhaliensis TaxID=419590 RepID=UPI0031FA0A99
MRSALGGLLDARSRPAWRAWSRGDVAGCARHAETLSGPSRDHLLFLCHSVRQSYEKALSCYDALAAAGRAPRALDEPVVAAWLHLGRPDRAVEHVRRRHDTRPRAVEQTLRLLDSRLRRPLGVRLDGATTLPFADHELAPYLPAVAATVDGVDVRAHLDTGAPFVVMGPRRAAETGVVTTMSGTDSHGAHRTELRHGTIAELRLGSASLTNVPVQVLSTLVGPQDLVIIGTNVLEQFLSTFDQPRHRLILSPRRHPDAAAEHSRLLADSPVAAELAFHLWADHYMFARGGFGPRDDLTFFIDSGLVHVDDAVDPPRQAGLLATSRRYRAWGVPRLLTTRPHFDSPEPVSLGPLTHQAPLVAVASSRATPWRSFGGVRVDGVLTHAFLKAYAWTLDFDEGRYVFRTAASHD